MPRTFKDWIQAYLTYNKNTESATIFHKWTAISGIASVLRRKVHFRFGRIKIFPNLYIVLVAEPGIARKTQAITFMEDFLVDTPGVHLAADATTPQALLNSIEEATDDAQMIDGSMLRHCSLTICSGEFSSFLGHKKENSRMVDILTDLFDCKSRPFKYNTKHSGSNTLPLPYLNLIAATTPGSISECFPSSAIGGGLSSRMLFVFAENKAMKVPIPYLDETRKQMYTPLLQDLGRIASIHGEFTFSEDGKDWWYDFYDKFDEQDPNRLCTDPSFTGWYSRKPLLLLKVSTIVSASRSPDLSVTKEDFITALKYIEEVEPNMGNAFSGVGRSDLTTDVDMLRKIIQRHGRISDRQLRQLVWRDVDDRKFEFVINTITKAGNEIGWGFEEGRDKGIYYYWKQTKKGE
jgi:hypothetical protein